MSLILGFSPTGHLLGVSTDAIGMEALLHPKDSDHEAQEPYRMRISWRRPGFGDTHAANAMLTDADARYQVSFSPEQLADYFFNVYFKMFEFENLGELLAGKKPKEWVRQLILSRAGNSRFYTRLSLVVLLHLAKQNILTNWPRCMERLLDKMEADQKLLVASDSLQELHMYLHLFGVWESPVLMMSPRHVSLMAYGTPASPVVFSEGLLGERDIPPVVYVTLVVPRQKLRIFTSDAPTTVPIPGIHISIRQEDDATGYENLFFAFQSFFGKLRHFPDCEGDEVEEDPSGWLGMADMIVTCAVPTYTLYLGPRNKIRVGLKVSTSPTTGPFSIRLGSGMAVFTCGILDTRHVHIMTHAPRLQPPWVNGPVQQATNAPAANSFTAYVNLGSDHQVASLQSHTQLQEGLEESKALRNGAPVSVTASSPCTVLLQVKGSAHRRLVFPFPIHGQSSKTRIARKSSWIDVLVSIAPAKGPGGYESNLFPIIHQEGSPPIVQSLSHVRLNQQPAISVGQRLEWFEKTAALTLSETENHEIQLDKQGRPANALLDLKCSLNIIFLSFVGLIMDEYGPFSNNFIFEFPKEGNGNNEGLDGMFLFASTLRHDLDAASVVLDAYIVPIIALRADQFSPAMAGLFEAKTRGRHPTARETVLWRYLLPALVERCRHTWAHSAKCQYREMNRVSLNSGESIICACGEGRDLDTFPQRSECLPFAKHATRIAIPLIFPVPYIERLRESDLATKEIRLPNPRSPLDNKTNAGLAGFAAPASTSAPAAAAAPPSCDSCGVANSAMKACARCGNARYCNHDFQKAAWKTHKKTCGKE